MPKRKLDEVDGLAECGRSGPADSRVGREESGGECGGSEDSNSSIQTNSSTDVPMSEAHATPDEYTKIRTRSKKNVKFKGVTVYYFQRKQGFVCVPSQGGSTLGMTDAHVCADNFSVKEYSQLQRQIHRQILAQQHGGKLPVSSRDRVRKRKRHDSADNSPSSSSSSSSSSATASSSSTTPVSGNKTYSSSSESESSDDDLNVDDYYFLQPVPTRQRRLMLRQAGIKKIDTFEKEECKDIRSSRESCGCDCRVYCDPETCSCSLAGIKCQVDRLSFPCGCTKEGCGNLSGRIEFNPIRVRTHFIHTLMRIEMDKKQEEEQVLRAKRLQENGPSRAESSPVCPELSDPDPLGAATKPHQESVEDNIEDITKYNSNERGSCCDCQNSDIHEFMMQESQFNGGINTGSMTVVAAPGTSQDCASAGAIIPTMDPVTTSSSTSQSSESAGGAGDKVVPQHLLFNDSDDEYSGENSASMYPFNKEESSYSESSDCSSEGSVVEADQNGTSAGYHHHQSFPHQPGQVYDNGLTPPPPSGSAYCIPHASSTTQPEQKFMDLTEPGSSYKLEPISEILNPIRFPSYSQAQNGSWGTCGGAPTAENFQSYESTTPDQSSSSQMPPTTDPAAYNSSVVHNNMNDDSQSSSSKPTSSSSTYSMYSTDHQSTPAADSMTCLMSTPQQLPEAYLEQSSYENGQADSSLSSQEEAAVEKDQQQPVDANKRHQNGHLRARVPGEQLQYHDLSNSMSSSGRQPSNDKDLRSSSSSSKQNCPASRSAAAAAASVFAAGLAEVNGDKSSSNGFGHPLRHHHHQAPNTTTTSGPSNPSSTQQQVYLDLSTTTNNLATTTTATSSSNSSCNNGPAKVREPVTVTSSVNGQQQQQLDPKYKDLSSAAMSCLADMKGCSVVLGEKVQSLNSSTSSSSELYPLSPCSQSVYATVNHHTQEESGRRKVASGSVSAAAVDSLTTSPSISSCPDSSSSSSSSISSTSSSSNLTSSHHHHRTNGAKDGTSAGRGKYREATEMEEEDEEVESPPSAQNFGEIIKESIVETVSA